LAYSSNAYVLHERGGCSIGNVSAAARLYRVKPTRSCGRR
jgi:hypothetical protein